MARQADEKQYSQQNKRSKAAAQQPNSTLVSFHPTVAEKDAIKAMEMSESECIDFLGELIDRGLTIKLTCNKAQTAYCAVVAPAGQAFGEGTSIAGFHASMFTLLKMCAYAVNVKWPDYPERPPKHTQLEFDW